jgi:hypothetical protein
MLKYIQRGRWDFQRLQKKQTNAGIYLMQKAITTWRHGGSNHKVLIRQYVYSFHLILSFIHSFIHSSIDLQSFIGPRPLLRFRNLFTQTVGLLGRVISPSQSRYLHTGQHKHGIDAHTGIHPFSGIRTRDPSVRASKGSSCFRSRGHRDRLVCS